MPRDFFRRLFLAAGATVVFLLGLEGLLVLLGVPAQGLYEGDRVTDWRLRPHLSERVLHSSTGESFVVETSSRGFRDEEWGEEGPGIVALGCSTTFGWGVEAKEAWPEQLESMLARPVLNAAVPGQTTHQGLRVALELLEENPEALILAWMIRDAQRAVRPDKDAKAPTGLRKTRLFRWLRGALETQADEVHEHQVHYRVAPQDYAQNLRRVLERAKERDVPVWLVAFPAQNPSSDHLNALRGLELPVIEPALPASAFFEEDPIHLTAGGHRQLAEQVFAAIQEQSTPAALTEEGGSVRLE